MDKKDKKKLESLNQKLSVLKRRLAGEKKAPDDPAAIPILEKEIAVLQEQVDKIKQANN
ncbi:MAG: hypothetical protein ACRC2T_19675 [Thermoguttaceae bacterium]